MCSTLVEGRAHSTMFFVLKFLFAGLVLLGELFSSTARPSSRVSRSAEDEPSPILPCNDPAREHLEALWKSHGAWHESIFLLENMESVVTLPYDDIDRQFIQVKEHPITGPRTCPFGNGTRQELSAYRQKTGGNVRICPSYDIINYDENRIPSILYEKRCSCKECGFILPPTSPSDNNDNPNSARTTLGCHPFTYYTKVLRRVRCDEEKNVFIYRATLEPFAVGCVCDHQSSRSSSKDPVITPDNRPPASSTATPTKRPLVRSRGDRGRRHRRRN